MTNQTVRWHLLKKLARMAIHYHDLAVTLDKLQTISIASLQLHAYAEKYHAKYLLAPYPHI